MGQILNNNKIYSSQYKSSPIIPLFQHSIIPWWRRQAWRNEKKRIVWRQPWSEKML